MAVHGSYRARHALSVFPFSPPFSLSLRVARKLTIFFGWGLGCHPFDDTDPFLFTHAPDLYVLGNQPHFDTCLATSPFSPSFPLCLRLVLAKAN